MKIQKETATTSKIMSKQEKEQYYEKLDREISNWAYQDQLKFEFSKKFVNDLHLLKEDHSNRIQIGPLDRKLFEYLVFSILVEYERSFWES